MDSPKLEILRRHLERIDEFRLERPSIEILPVRRTPDVTIKFMSDVYVSYSLTLLR